MATVHQLGQSAPLAVPTSAPQGAPGAAPGVQPLPSVLEPAASRAADTTAFDQLGARRRLAGDGCSC